MRAEYSTIYMRLVQYDISQSAQCAIPRFVIRQYAYMQHVRICQYDVLISAYIGAFAARRIAIEYAL